MFNFKPSRRSNRRASLRLSLLISVFAPLAVLSAVVVYLTLAYVEHGMEQRMQEDVQLVARAIQRPVSQELERHERSRVRRALQSAFRIRRVYGAYVYDMNGKRIAAAGDVTPERAHPHVLRLAASDRRGGEFDRVAGQRVYSYFVPLSGNGHRIIGLLQVTRKRTDFDATMTHLRIGAAVVVLVMLALIAGVILVGHRRAIGRHLAGLVDVMRRVQGGDNARRARAAGPREIAEVAGALNNMLDGMAAAEREITSRKANEEQLENRLRENEKLAALGHFAAGVAHELGGTLTVIDAKARRVLRKRGEQSRELVAIRDEVGRADRVIRQILALARRGPSRRRRQSCARIARDAIAAVDEGAGEGRVKLVRECSRREARAVEVEPMRVRQALVNLLHNALEAGAGRVELSFGMTGNEAKFAVADDGPGIDPSLRQRIFDPFFTTRGNDGGSGLGLALAQGIVLDHGGSISVSSSRLGGACFSIDLPAVNVEGPE
jgi:signal transduction histidine kinase